MLYNKKKYINIYLFIFLWLICLISFNPEKYSNYSNWKNCNISEFLKEIFLSPWHDRFVTIKSWNFSIGKVWCCMGLYWSTRGCNLAAHSFIHASFILRRGLTRFILRRGLTRFQQPKGFLGLIIIEFRNSSNILEWGHTDRKHHTHCSQSFVSPDWIPTGPYSWQP